MHKPAWFKPGLVAVSNASTCGINKDGEDLFLVDENTGRRTAEIDDQLARDTASLISGEASPSLAWVHASDVKASRISVPTYYDERAVVKFEENVSERWSGFKTLSLRDLMAASLIEIHRGHGSPSADLRSGDVPYIKVSDLRAGLVNINPTNRVSDAVAKRFWRGSSSGLRPFDLITPARTSKNIGDFSVLMPGQEQVVLTREVLVLRPGKAAEFDSFFLLWAMSLRTVQAQWKRIIFMQTNREDTGDRFGEIRIPFSDDAVKARRVSSAFRRFYLASASLRQEFQSYLSADPDHHVYLGGSEEIGDDDRD